MTEFHRKRSTSAMETKSGFKKTWHDDSRKMRENPQMPINTQDSTSKFQQSESQVVSKHLVEYDGNIPPKNYKRTNEVINNRMQRKHNRQGSYSDFRTPSSRHRFMSQNYRNPYDYNKHTKNSFQQRNFLKDGSCFRNCDEVKFLTKNALDCITDPNSPNNFHLPKPPYGIEWSHMFKHCGFPQHLVSYISKCEFEDYMNQPYHKEGDGLFYGEFQDMPPRFQKQAMQHLNDLFRNAGMDVKVEDVMKNPSLFFCRPRIESDTQSPFFTNNEIEENATGGGETNYLDKKLEKSLDTKNTEPPLDKLATFVDGYIPPPKATLPPPGFKNSLKNVPSKNISSPVITNELIKCEQESCEISESSVPPLVFENSNLSSNAPDISSDVTAVKNSSQNDLSKDCDPNMKKILALLEKRSSSFSKNISSSEQVKTSHTKSELNDKPLKSFGNETIKPFSKITCKAFEDKGPKLPYDDFNKNAQKADCKQSFRAGNKTRPCECDIRPQINKETSTFPQSPNISGTDHQKIMTKGRKERNYKQKSLYSDSICPVTEEAVLSQSSETDSLSSKCSVERKVSVNLKNQKQSFSSKTSCQNMSTLSKYEDGDTKTLSNGFKIWVSKSHDLSYWKKYFGHVLSHQNFNILNSKSTDRVLELVIPDGQQFQATLTVLKMATHALEPHIKYVSKIKSHDNKFHLLSEKIVRQKENLKKSMANMYEHYYSKHDKKTNNIRKKYNNLRGKKHYNNGYAYEKDSIAATEQFRKKFINPKGEKNCNDDPFEKELMAVKEQLDMFEQMSDVYEKAYQKINDILDIVKNDSEITELEANFRQECNFLEGSLPIYSKKDKILSVIAQNQVTVLIAETGSGKSTQLTQYLLQAGFAENGTIVCTQPRRIAAISIARYISKLLGSPLGKEVGYETGLSSKVTRESKIVYMTDCTLLKKCIRSKTFKEISCIIVDEAHERSLYTDLLLGLLKRALTERNDLKVIITSATIDPSIFLEYFREFNVSKANSLIEIPGRCYPVTVHWHPTNVFIGWDYFTSTVNKAFDVHSKSEEGDILVFLPTPREIEDALEAFQKLKSNSKRRLKLEAKLLKLHGRLDTEDQLQVFEPAEEGCRKIIFATNSAETSITVKGIKYVIDSGMSKERTYDVDKKRSVLTIGFVNQSSAEQRKGRAGRTQPGVCYRMYTEKNFNSDMISNLPPEILRVNLNQAVLEILHLGIQPEKFDFICAPPKSSIKEALDSLINLGAVEKKYEEESGKEDIKVTELGRKIVKIPLEPHLAKFILLGSKENVSSPKIAYASIIAAAMTTVSGRIFLRPEDKKEDADKAKTDFCYLGDFLTYLYLYMRWDTISKQNESDANQWCFEKFVSSKGMKIASQIVNDLCVVIAKELKIPIDRTKFNTQDENFQMSLEKILFDCFKENICVFSGHEKSGYVSPFHNGTFFIHPSSAVKYCGGKSPKFIIFESILKTSRTFLVNVTPIREETIVAAKNFELSLESLNKMQVHSNPMKHLGETVLINYILGKEGMKIKQIEDTIQTITGSRTFYIEVNVQKGEIVTYVEPHNQKFVDETLKKYIDKAHDELSKEEMSINDFRPFTFSLTCGGEVKDMVLPGEFKELECQTSSHNKTSLINKLETFGMTSSYESTSEDKKNVTFIASFLKVIDAEKALNSLKLSKDYVISGKPHISQPISQKPLPLYVVTVVWNRSPCSGSGWVEFKSPIDCRTACFQLTNNRLSIDNYYINIEPSKQSVKKIYMRNIPSWLDDDDVKLALEKHLHGLQYNEDSKEIFEITLNRLPVPEATENVIRNIKRDLQRAFLSYTSLKNLTVNVKPPKPEDKKWKAQVYFANVEEGNTAVMNLQGKMKINNIKVHLKRNLKFTLPCKRFVYKILRKEIEIFLKKQHSDRKCERYTIEQVADGLVNITVFCKNTKDLFCIRFELQRLTQGLPLACNDNPYLLSLLNQKVSCPLREIESNLNVHIIPDEFKKVFFIYGRKHHCERAKNEIQALGKEYSHIHKKKYDLSCNHIPSGFVKKLYSRHGMELKNLIIKFQLKHAFIDVNSHQLIIEGATKKVQEADAYLDGMCKELYEKMDKERRNSNNEACPVCFDEELSDKIRLEHCGHAVCKLCLHLQVRSGVFPLTCVQKDCGKPFFVEDLRRIFAGQDDLKKTVCNTALKHFVQTNLREVRYCPTPNCQMIYRLNIKDPEFKCPSCEYDICTVCHTFYHHGMTCDMYKKTLTDEDYPLKVWLNKDTGNRKTCPTCNTAIEKDGGCNHIICSACESHLCWLCLGTFKTSDEVYEHMPYCESRLCQ